MATKRTIRRSIAGGVGGLAVAGAIVLANPLGAGAHDTAPVAVPTYDATGAALLSAQQQQAVVDFLQAKIAEEQAEVAKLQAALAAAQAAQTTAAPVVTKTVAVRTAATDPRPGCDHDGAAGVRTTSYRGGWDDGGDHHRR